MTEKSATQRDGMMRKIQALLDKAAGTTFDAERDTFLKKADELMVKFAIEEAELAARESGKRVGATVPEVRDFVVPRPNSWDMFNELAGMFQRLARHLGVKLAPNGQHVDGGYKYRVVGYPADLDYLAMLFLNLQLHFLSSMEPKRDDSLSDVENFAAMWEAGMNYERIWKAMDWPESKRPKTVRAAYHRWCEESGREPIKGLKSETYMKSFLVGYSRRIDARLDEMKRAREEAAKGHELVLAGRSNDLDEFYWGLFPDTRPHPKDCECESCHFYRCNDEKCTRTRCKEYRKNRNKPVRYRSPKAMKVNAAAMQRGREVANDADLGGGRVANRKDALKS